MGHNRFVKEVFTVKKIYEPVKMNHIELKSLLLITGAQMHIQKE